MNSSLFHTYCFHFSLILSNYLYNDTFPTFNSKIFFLLKSALTLATLGLSLRIFCQLSFFCIFVLRIFSLFVYLRFVLYFFYFHCVYCYHFSYFIWFILFSCIILDSKRSFIKVTNNFISNI